MPIEEDFDAHVAAQMCAELSRFSDRCHYDEARKLIVYHDDQSALAAYMTIQREEMERHKWIESEKSHCDLGREALADWVKSYSAKFSRYWRRTHLFIPPKNVPQNS